MMRGQQEQATLTSCIVRLCVILLISKLQIAKRKDARYCLFDLLNLARVNTYVAHRCADLMILLEVVNARDLRAPGWEWSQESPESFQVQVQFTNNFAAAHPERLSRRMSSGFADGSSPAPAWVT